MGHFAQILRERSVLRHCRLAGNAKTIMLKTNSFMWIPMGLMNMLILT